jgi:alpha-ribazole phosphatase
VLILLRHGQTTANAQARLQGHIDLPLDNEGVAQAMRCGVHIRSQYPNARVVSSPLQRAQQTAAAISDEVEVDERFIELNYGDWDGVSLREVDQQKWAQWRQDPHFRPPNGETLVELDVRVRPALEELFAESKERDIVVVSHVSPIKSAITWALGVGPEVTWRCHLDRASICRVSHGARGPSLSGMNETAHLL